MKKLHLDQNQLVMAAAQMAAATLEKDMALAQEIGRLFDCADPYEYAALHFFRYLNGMESVQKRLNDDAIVL